MRTQGSWFFHERKMIRQKQVLNWRGWSRMRTLLFLWLAALVLMGCQEYVVSLQPTQSISTPPVSPLIPGSNRVMAENEWRLVEIQFHGESVKFDSLAPVYFSFNGSGSLGFRTTGCNGIGFAIFAENEYRYRLSIGVTTAMDCSEIRLSQEQGISQAVRATTEYEMQGNQLFLFGDGVRITLVMDGPQ